MIEPESIVGVEITLRYASGAVETITIPRLAPDPAGLDIRIEEDPEVIDYLPDHKRVGPSRLSRLRASISGDLLRDDSQATYYHRIDNA